MATTAIYFVTGKGVKMCFNGSAYQDPDKAAIEEGQRLAKSFKNVKVIKITGKKVETIFKAPTRQEVHQQRIKHNLQVYFPQH